MLAQADRDTMAKLQIDSRYTFDFAAQARRVAFAPCAVAERARRDREAANAALSQEGELGPVPRVNGGDPMVVFASRLEQFCGYQPSAALRVVGLH